MSDPGFRGIQVEKGVGPEHLSPKTSHPMGWDSSELIRGPLRPYPGYPTTDFLQKPAELLKIECVLCDQIPVVRRFTGGGTVVVDPSTIFVTFICNKDAVAGLQPYPQPIMSWTGALYNKVFQGIGDFHLRENDYVFGDRKFGGNAQSITKNRWIHHTSFLWDYEVRNMAYLKLPARAPEYRLVC
uniref:BPL/LPL catalytic domain-containing protein n=1 Tax=Quercus lobata TaxID=97700 RepID=A0A7N2LXG4_QUELO